MHIPSTLLRDLRDARRSLIANRTFSVMAIASLALSIGLGTTMAGVLDAIAHPKVPFHDVDRLFEIRVRSRAVAPGVMATFRERLRHARTFELATARRLVASTIGQGADRQDVSVAAVSPNYFDVLGTPIVRGRQFHAADDPAATQNATVLSARAWQRTFGARTALERATVAIDDTLYDVIGVAPEAVGTTTGVDAWIVDRASIEIPGSMTTLLARLAPGASPGMATREAQSIAHTILDRRGSPPSLVELASARPDPLRFKDYHFALTGAVLFLILIACANIAALLLTRGAVRRREFAVRAALGATRADLVRQVLTECALLAAVGGLLGIVLAEWGISVAATSMSDTLRDSLAAPQFNWRVGGAGFGAVAATLLLFGLLPALASADVDISDALKDSSGTSTGRRGGRFTQLVVAEFAAAMVLIVGAGLMARTLARAARFDFGYDMSNLVSFQAVPAGSIDLLGIARMKHDTTLRNRIFNEAAATNAEALDALRHTPMLESAALTMGRRADGGRLTSDAGTFGPGAYRVVSPDFFRTFGIRIVQGRDFEPGDAHDPGSAIVDQNVARELWHGASAVGRLVKLGNASSSAPWVRVVGVSRLAYFSLPSEFDASAPPLVAVVNATSASTPGGTIVARGRVGVSALPSRLLAAVRAAAPGSIVTGIRPWEADFDAILRRQELFGAIFTFFGVTGLLLAGIGLYGVVAYAVAQRQREFAVRVAMGAAPSHIVALVARLGGVMVLAGTGIGALVALWGVHFLDSLLYGLYAIDAPTVLVAELMLFATGALACWAPTRRAIRSDPLDALRSN